MTNRKVAIATIVGMLAAFAVLMLNIEFKDNNRQLREDMTKMENRFNTTVTDLLQHLKETDAELAKVAPLLILVNPDNIVQLTGMRVHMYRPTRKECGNTPWTTSWGTRAKPMRTAAISRKLKAHLDVKFGDILIVDGHPWIIESNMGKKETAHFDLMYPIGTKQFRLLDATVYIIRVASAK